MLVCNVSLRPPRSAIAAAIVETVTATDATATGNIVFATLVDDPASVRDTVDAYLGEIMLEAAGASDSIDAGLIYNAAVDETLTASATQDGVAPAIYTGLVNETASANSLQGATTVAAAARAARTLSTSYPGFRSVVVADAGTGKTQIISNIGGVR